MTHTQNYNLSQWEKSDRILMENFNSDNAAIDTALTAHANSIAKLGNCGIEIYSYTGTGTYGSSNPTVIRFARMPTFFILTGCVAIIAGRGGAASAPSVLRNSNGDTRISDLALTWNGTAVSFVNGSTLSQANEAGRTYTVIAFYMEDRK